jgi:hypothetical protein
MNTLARLPMGGEGLEREALSSAGRLQDGLRALVVAAVVGGVLAVLLIDSAIPLAVRLLALGFWVLCLAPAWVYLGVRPELRRPVPLLPFIGILYGLYYPLSVVLGSYGKYSRVNVVPESDYAAPVILATLGWVSLLLGYIAVQAATIGKVREWSDDWDFGVGLRWGIALMWVGIGVQAVRMTVGIPIIFAGTVVFLVSVGYFGMGLLAFLVFRNGLRGYSAAMLLTGIAASIVMLTASGAMGAVVQPVLVLLFSVWIARQTLSMRWIGLTLVAVCALLALKSVILQFRSLSSFTGDTGIGARVELLWDVVNQNAERTGIAQMVLSGGDAIAVRSSLMDLFADVVRRTPDQVPYWDGQTYVHLVGSFVPRFVWQSKPEHRVGNEFGHRYGYVDTGDLATSWNLPTLVEFYVNFGDLAVLFGMFLVGALYSGFCVVLNRPGQSPLVSIAAVVLSLLLVNVESDFSLVFGALVMQGGAVWLVVLLIIRASRRVTRRAGMRAATAAEAARWNAA